MFKKLLILFLISFILGVFINIAIKDSKQIVKTENKKCIAKINACSKNGICGLQSVKTC